MKYLVTEIKKRIIILKNAIVSAEKDNKKFPEGNLRISKCQHHTRYYKVLDNLNTTGEYISIKNTAFIKKLAQKEYNKDFLKQARQELLSLEKFLNRLQKMNADKVFEKLSSTRKNLVTPYIQPDNLYAEEWQSRNFIPNPYMPEKKIYTTRKGEQVRSKSEAIIADMLLELEIPYHYEKPLAINRREVRYPDFTLLKISTREEIYLEHFGMLDDDEYRKASLKKLDDYRKSGVFLGKNLIITYETEECPLDISGIKEMLKYLFLS